MPSQKHTPLTPDDATSSPPSSPDDATNASSTNTSSSAPETKRRRGPVRRSRKGGWTQEEDEILRAAVKEFNGKSWKKIAERLPNRTNVQCLHRWQKVLNPDLVKGPWTEEEDQKIIDLVKKHGCENWSLIANNLEGRIGKQCRERYFNQLDPTIKKTPWTEEEKRILMESQAKMGNKWAEISKILVGRPNNQCKNMYHSIMAKRRKALRKEKNAKTKKSGSRGKRRANSTSGTTTTSTAPVQGAPIHEEQSQSMTDASPGTPNVTVSNATPVTVGATPFSSSQQPQIPVKNVHTQRFLRSNPRENLRRGHHRSYSDSAVLQFQQNIFEQPQMPGTTANLVDPNSGGGGVASQPVHVHFLSPDFSNMFAQQQQQQQQLQMQMRHMRINHPHHHQHEPGCPLHHQQPQQQQQQQQGHQQFHFQTQQQQHQPPIGNDHVASHMTRQPQQMVNSRQQHNATNASAQRDASFSVDNIDNLMSDIIGNEQASQHSNPAQQQMRNVAASNVDPMQQGRRRSSSMFAASNSNVTFGAEDGAVMADDEVQDDIFLGISNSANNDDDLLDFDLIKEERDEEIGMDNEGDQMIDDTQEAKEPFELGDDMDALSPDTTPLDTLLESPKHFRMRGHQRSQSFDPRMLSGYRFQPF